MPEIIYFKTQKDFRKWLEKNYITKAEQWVGFYKKNSGKESMDWPGSVDEALCFGWIDGIRKNVDEESYKIRFTPRKPGSNWSAVNINKMEALIKGNLVKPEGLKIYNERKTRVPGEYSYENRPESLGTEYEKIFKKNKKAWDFFTAQSPSYKRTASWWVLGAKRDETRLKRLTTLIEDSGNNKKIGAVTLTKKS
jgi:uncharacterized protein YdeI (YjbR/CyaY-like superfamily)